MPTVPKCISGIPQLQFTAEVLMSYLMEYTNLNLWPCTQISKSYGQQPFFNCLHHFPFEMSNSAAAVRCKEPNPTWNGVYSFTSVIAFINLKDLWPITRLKMPESGFFWKNSFCAPVNALVDLWPNFCHLHGVLVIIDPFW